MLGSSLGNLSRWPGGRTFQKAPLAPPIVYGLAPRLRIIGWQDELGSPYRRAPPTWEGPVAVLAVPGPGSPKSIASLLSAMIRELSGVQIITSYRWLARPLGSLQQVTKGALAYLLSRPAVMPMELVSGIAKALTPVTVVDIRR
jgi:hypothetical protein